MKRSLRCLWLLILACLALLMPAALGESGPSPAHHSRSTEGIWQREITWEVSQQDAVAYPTISFSLTNTSQEAVEITQCTLEWLDAAGEHIAYEPAAFLPAYLEPGDTAYGTARGYHIGHAMADYSQPRLSVEWEPSWKTPLPLRCTWEWDEDVLSNHLINMVVENLSDQTVDFAGLMLVERDAQGNLMRNTILSYDSDNEEFPHCYILPAEETTQFDFWFSLYFSSLTDLLQGNGSLESLVAPVLMNAPAQSLLTDGQALESSGMVLENMLWSVVQSGAETAFFLPYELTNTSESPLEIKSCLIELYSRTGALLYSFEDINLYPKTVEPGGSAYGNVYEHFLGILADEVFDVKIHPIAQAAAFPSFSIPLTAEKNILNPEMYWLETDVTTRNHTERLLGNGVAVGVYYDGQGNFSDVKISLSDAGLFRNLPFILQPGDAVSFTIHDLPTAGMGYFNMTLYGMGDFKGFLCPIAADPDFILLTPEECSQSAAEEYETDWLEWEFEEFVD